MYAYLKDGPLVGQVLAALAETGGPTVVLADGINPAVRRKFEAVRSMRFKDRRLDMGRVRNECDLAVHNANHGTLCQLLMGGRPMVQIPLTLEQRVLARKVEALGAAETVTGRGEGAAEEARRKLMAVATEPRYAEAARRFAARYAAFDPAAAVGWLVGRVECLAERTPVPPGKRRAKVFAG